MLLVIDCSGSMGDRYNNGEVQGVAERALALALNFDDDGRVPAVAFDSRCIELVEVTATNLASYVDREVVRKHRLGGGTNYAPALAQIARKYTGRDPSVPGFCIFVTDGNCDDRSASERLVRELSVQPIFWEFVGVGSEAFTFLKKLDTLTGRKVDNAGFLEARSLGDVTYQALLKEFSSYPSTARRAGILQCFAEGWLTWPRNAGAVRARHRRWSRRSRRIDRSVRASSRTDTDQEEASVSSTSTIASTARRTTTRNSGRAVRVRRGGVRARRRQQGG